MSDSLRSRLVRITAATAVSLAGIGIATVVFTQPATADPANGPTPTPTPTPTQTIDDFPWGTPADGTEDDDDFPWG